MGLREFRIDIIQAIHMHMYRRVDDNFDAFRYNYDGVDRSNQVDALQHSNYLNYFLDNVESFYAAWLQLSDQASRDLYLRLIKYRILGHPHLRINEAMTFSAIKARYDKAATYVAGPSALDFNGQFGRLQHMENIPFDDGVLRLDAWPGNIAYGLGQDGHRQYYFARDGLRIRPERGDVIVDGGACFGDTSVFFASSAGPEGRVFSFEPLPEHLNVIRHNIAQNAMADRVTLVAAGIGETSNRVEAIDERIKALANPGFSMSGRENQVPIMSIDDLVARNAIDKMDFIKLDIEGFELQGLKGAAQTIARHRPKLAISLYHKPQDFFEIPLHLKTLYPFYRLHLDHYTIFAEETVLYAIAD